MQKTTMAVKENLLPKRKWYEIDATGLVLGDLSVAVADVLRGKNKPIFTPNVDCGDYVIIRNAKNIVLTGNKLEGKKYYNHSQYIGGLRTRTAGEMKEKYSKEMLHLAIRGMIPQNRLGDAIARKLFVYEDAGKDHSAQNPIKLSVIKEIKK